MTADEIGIETLERLSRLETQGHPVLSIYLDLDPSRFPTPAARDVQLRALFGEARREAADSDVDRIQALLQAEPRSRTACGDWPSSPRPRPAR
jgi:hypothetical protein